MSDPTPTEKRCSKCGATKPLEAFSKDQHGKYGCKSSCKACVAQHTAVYNAANREAVRSRSDAWKAVNPDKIRAYSVAYRAANIEVVREREKAYRAANADKIHAQGAAYRAANAETLRLRRAAHYATNIEKMRKRCSAYHAAHADAIHKRHRAHYAANIERARERRQAWRAANVQKIRDYTAAYRAAKPDVHRAANQRRTARMKENGGEGFSPEQLSEMRKAQNGLCPYCQYQYDPDDLTIDHVIPTTQGGPHEAANIVLACPICNSSKNDRTPEQWTNRWYLRPPHVPKESKGEG